MPRVDAGGAPIPATAERTRARRARFLWAAALLAIFVFRLAFGLSKDLFADDESQIYLLGLRFHATHHWPYFGPDVIWTRSEIPGALQALLVGLPLDVLPVPEAPYVLLNLLSMGALSLFAWYLCRRLPAVPRWLVWGWLLTIPWTLEYSTHVLNTSYTLPAAAVFFVGFFEAWPPLTIGRIRAPVAHAMMGAALGWMIQIHMSWPLLLPFAAAALVARAREGQRSFWPAAGAFAAGALVTGSLLLPTFVTFGLSAGGGSTEQNLHLHWRNPLTTFGTTVARFLSFATFEVGRFIAQGSAKQVVLLAEHWWLVPAAGVAWVAGLLHPAWMALTAFRRRTPYAHWAAVRWTAAAAVLVVTASFFVVMEPAQARSFYAVAPVAWLYAAYCWTFLDSPRWRRVAAALLVVNAVLQVSLIALRLPGSSLYVDRPLVAAAIRSDKPDIFGYRRWYARDAPPEDRTVEGGSPTARADLAIESATRRQAVWGFNDWSVVIHNRSATRAYRSVLCETRYFDASGARIDEQITEVWTVIEPDASVAARLIDQTRWNPSTARAEVSVFFAEPVEPWPATAADRPRLGR